ncbi:MAG: tRNA guanosine(34) transglycosylase Tgt [Planctomycetes bacterium]|nr:tRNA guanosine(34) transglycosylase Tgt [Planctomycetota bacterium]MBM4058080.1 tRNA guanosine(34) transglycosylase Tgt [Planctomycetota bacterium]
MGPVHLRIEATSARARAGVLSTPHGVVPTPLFMPVGTAATVKGVDIGRVTETGAGMVLANTYHLHLRPGEEIVAAAGGLARFMGWRGPTLTDSGGFQVFSLARQVRVTDAGAVFRSHVDGRAIDLTPEEAVRIQEALGADIIMQLDHVIALPADHGVVADAMRRSLHWAERCRAAKRRADQALFGIVQGGLEADLRAESAARLRDLDLPGYAVGGLSVGEGPEAMRTTLAATVPHLPADRPRYLMGVGKPADIVAAVAAGIDMFDCVLPTRCGRNALAFTSHGEIRLRNARHTRDEQPIEEDCPCAACRHGRGYLRHLFQAGEMLGPILLSIHNLTFYQRLVARLRGAIVADRFEAEHDRLLSLLEPGGAGEPNTAG